MKQKWTEKPVTWGGWFKLSVVCGLIGMVTSVYYYTALFEPDWLTSLKASVKDRFKKINRER